MESAFDFELVGAVENESVLWDVRNVDYKNRDRRALAWATVASNLGGGKDAKTCQTRWKAIRDKLVRYKKAQDLPSGSGAKKFKAWALEPLLTFLDSSIVSRKSFSSFPVPEGMQMPNSSKCSGSENIYSCDVEIDEVIDDDDAIFLEDDAEVIRAFNGHCGSTGSSGTGPPSTSSPSVGSPSPSLGSPLPTGHMPIKKKIAGKQKRSEGLGDLMPEIKSLLAAPPPAVIQNSANQNWAKVICDMLDELPADTQRDLRMRFLNETNDAIKESKQ